MGLKKRHARVLNHAHSCIETSNITNTSKSSVHIGSPPAPFGGGQAYGTVTVKHSRSTEGQTQTCVSCHVYHAVDLRCLVPQTSKADPVEKAIDNYESLWEDHRHAIGVLE